MKAEKESTVYEAVKVPVAFSVSVTGHRSLSYSDNFDALVNQVAVILEQLREICRKNDSAVNLRLNVALAVGADQIAALAVHKANKSADYSAQNWLLQTILPFERTTYERALELGLKPDNAVSVRNNFSSLLKVSNSVYELADRECVSDYSSVGNATRYWQNTRYQTLGHMLSRQADILLALWNGDDGGKGGTADVVTMALNQGKPVLRLDPTSMAISWLMPHLGSTDPIALACNPTLGPVSDIDDLLANEHGDGLQDLVMRLLSLPVEANETSNQQNEIQANDPDGLMQNTGATGYCDQLNKKPKPVFSTAAAFLGSNTFSLQPQNDEPQGARLLKFNNSFYNIFLWSNWLRERFAANSFPGKTEQSTRAFVYQRFVDFLVKDTKRKTESDTSENEITEPTNTKMRGLREIFLLKTDYALDDWIQQPYGIERLLPATDRPVHVDKIDEQLKPAMISTDAIATARGHMYRSSYVLTFLGGALAVWIGLSGIFTKDYKHWFVLTELLLLLGLVAFYYMANRRSWHDRWLNARHITESLRAGRFLVWLGLGGRRALHEDAPWSAWYTNAVMATAPLPHYKLRDHDIRYIAGELRSHVNEQINYHKKNCNKLMTLHHRLDSVGWICLGLTILTALIYVAGKLSPYSDSFQLLKNPVTLICAGLPALAGALLGIRFQGDFERFAERSDQTRKELNKIDTRLSVLVKREPTTFEQPLYEELVLIVQDLLNVFEKDIEDWRFVYSARPNPEAA